MKNLIFLLILFLTGCFSPQIPKWYTKTYQDNDIYMYGTGEGKTKKEAVNDALNEISSKIYIKIKSTFISQKSQYKTQNENLYTDFSSLNITSSTKPIDFHNYEIIKLKKDNKYYVLLRINRIKNAKFICSNVQIPNYNFNSDLNFLFKSKKIFNDLNQKISKVQIANLISPVCNYKLQKLLNIKQKLLNRYKNLNIKIKSNDKTLKTYLNEFLQKYINIKNKANITLYATNSINYKKIGNYYIANMNINLLFTNKEKKEFNILCSGSSIENKNIAKDFASKNCIKKIKQLFKNYFPNSF